ncbi:MAG: helix-turn-helix transcriptional regulator [Bacteroidales bacterium]|nr:helix-turn-helix transcriptional regulator [Candidatus Latescibacterota bacterium]
MILTRNDEILLLAVLRLKDNAYGVTIIAEVEQRAGKKLKFGGLWVSMDNLAKKNLVEKRMADPEPHRGGKSKCYYRLTKQGILALKETAELQENLWKGIPGIIEGTEGA